MRSLALAASLILLPIAGCHGCSNAGQSASSGQTSKLFHLRGKIISTDSGKGQIIINHEAIPGFMEAMTMPYQLKDPKAVLGLHPGDLITADVLVPADQNADVLLDNIKVVGQARPGTASGSAYHIPTPGDSVPDFALTNQDGHPIHLSQFRGRALLVTFIYTRCPMPNFCPWVTNRFAELEKQILADPRLAARTHLISISFDPEHDTPSRLRSYGIEHRPNGSAFDHWEFAVAERAALPQITQYFDLALSAQPDATINHTLSTTLIGPDGKVAAFYPGNSWTTADALAALRNSAQQN